MRAGRATDLSAVFVDRDGVINLKAPEGEYVTSWEEFHFAPGALEGLRELAGLGVPVIVVTNQRGVARGRMTEEDMRNIHSRMLAAVRAAGGRIDAVYVCPHEGGCECRKPGTKLYEDAAREVGFDLASSAAIGDRASDMEAARRVGALPVFVRGYPEDPGEIAVRAADLLEAARALTR